LTDVVEVDMAQVVSWRALVRGLHAVERQGVDRESNMVGIKSFATSKVGGGEEGMHACER
jgi:hypothetical protein